MPRRSLPSRPFVHHALTLGIAVVAAMSLLNQVRQAGSGWPMDFYHYWLVPKIVSQLGPVDIYRLEDRERFGELSFENAQETNSARLKYAANQWKTLMPTGSPFFYAVLSPLMTADFDGDLETFRILSLLFYAGGLLALTRGLGLPLVTFFGLIPLCVDLFGPFQDDVTVANVNQIQIGLLGVVLLLAGRWRTAAGAVLAGAVLGLAFAFKSNVLYVVVLLAGLLLVRRDWRRLGFAAGGFLVSVGAAFFAAVRFFGYPRVWVDWSSGVREMLLSPRYVDTTFLGMLFGGERLLTSRGLWPFWLLGLALCAVPLLLLGLGAARAVAPREATAVPDEITLGSLGLAVLLLSGNVVHYHYFTLALPLLIVLAARAGLDPGPSRAGTLAHYALLALAYAMLSGLLQSVVPLESQMSVSLWNYLGTALLYGLAVVALWPGRSSTPAGLPA